MGLSSSTTRSSRHLKMQAMAFPQGAGMSVHYDSRSYPYDRRLGVGDPPSIMATFPVMPQRSALSMVQPRPRSFLTMRSTSVVTDRHEVVSEISKKVPLLLRGGAAVVMSASSASVGTWIIPAMLCATSYALYNLFIKKASASIDPILGGVLLQFVAALVGSMLLGFQQLKASSSGASVLKFNKKGLYWSVAAGTAVGAAEILSFIISGMGVPATQSIPIIIGGSILVGTLLGAAWLGESLSKSGWAGVFLIAAGIALVGMDPGSGVGH